MLFHLSTFMSYLLMLLILYYIRNVLLLIMDVLLRPLFHYRSRHSLDYMLLLFMYSLSLFNLLLLCLLYNIVLLDLWNDMLFMVSIFRLHLVMLLIFLLYIRNLLLPRSLSLHHLVFSYCLYPIHTLLLLYVVLLHYWMYMHLRMSSYLLHLNLLLRSSMRIIHLMYILL